MSATPLVSGVMAAHNRQALLPRTVESIQAQTESEFDLIVAARGVPGVAGTPSSASCTWRATRFRMLQSWHGAMCSIAAATRRTRGSERTGISAGIGARRPVQGTARPSALGAKGTRPREPDETAATRLAAQRQVLRMTPEWLRPENIDRPRPPHREALANQFVREARSWSGVRGVLLCLRALAVCPANRSARGVLRELVSRARGRVERRFA
jgi:hypothetical protein